MVSAWVVLIIAIILGLLTWWFKRSVADAFAIAALSFLVIGILFGAAAIGNIFRDGFNWQNLQNQLAGGNNNLAGAGWAAFLGFISFIYLIFWVLWKIFWVPRGF